MDARRPQDNLCRRDGGKMAPKGPDTRDTRGRGKEDIGKFDPA